MITTPKSQISNLNIKSQISILRQLYKLRRTTDYGLLTRSNLIQRLIQISDYVLNILDAHRDPHETIRDSQPIRSTSGTEA